MLLIIDNTHYFIRIYENKLKKQGIPYKFYYHNEQVDLSLKDKVKGLILSGGAGDPYQPLNLTANFVAMLNFDVPIISFCLGYEIVGVSYGATVGTLPDFQNKLEDVHIEKPEDPIFAGLDKKTVKLREQHNFKLNELPRFFIRLGYSDVCPIEIMRHKHKPIYGFQGHPEVSGRDGNTIMENFYKICGM